MTWTTGVLRTVWEIVAVERTQLTRAEGRSGVAVSRLDQSWAERAGGWGGGTIAAAVIGLCRNSPPHQSAIIPTHSQGSCQGRMSLFLSSPTFWFSGRLNNEPSCLPRFMSGGGGIRQNWPCFVEQEFVLMLCFVSVCRYHLRGHDECAAVHYGQVHR